MTASATTAASRGHGDTRRSALTVVHIAGGERTVNFAISNAWDAWARAVGQPQPALLREVLVRIILAVLGGLLAVAVTLTAVAIRERGAAVIARGEIGQGCVALVKLCLMILEIPTVPFRVAISLGLRSSLLARDVGTHTNFVGLCEVPTALLGCGDEIASCRAEISQHHGEISVEDGGIGEIHAVRSHGW